MKAVVERRQFRRADVDVAVEIRPQRDGGLGEPIAGQVKNVSLAGVLSYVQAPCALQAGDQVVCSMTIPESQNRFFPFTRLHGKGWVVRIDEIASGRRAGDVPEGEQWLGLAIAFAPDVTALGSIGF